MTLDLAAFPTAPLAEVETFSKPGTADVTPSDLKKISPIVKHYASMAHPFTACYRDQIKHGLSDDHAKRRCAVVKMLGQRGSGGKSVKEQVAEEMGWPVARLDKFVEDCKRELSAITASVGVDPVREAMAGGLSFMLTEAADAGIGPESLMEADLSEAGRKKMAKAKTAMADGSFPIPNTEFLQKAIKAFGRAKNKDAVKAWIKSRARALGATKMLPSNWAVAEAESELYLMAEELAAAIDLFAPLPDKVGEAYSPPNWVIPKQARQPGFKPVDPPKTKSSSSSSRSSSSSSSYDENKHPRNANGEFLQKGHSGPAVSGVQKRLGIKVTGTFNDQTKSRIERYQRNHGLTVDGIVGRQTAASLLGKSPRSIGALTSGLRSGLQSLRHKSKEEVGELLEADQLQERTLHTAVQQRDNGVKSATHSSIRSALFDLGDSSNPTHTVKLPNGTTVKVATADRPGYGSYGRKFTVTNGAESYEASGVEEAADTAKELDSRQPGASGTPVSTSATA